MTNLKHVAFKDLERRGVVVIRSFLSPEEIEAFRSDYANQPFGANQNYRLKHASADANERLLQRVTEVLSEVVRQTDLQVDGPQGATYFATGKSDGVNFPWHQDHESFFELQNHYDYLNFYIPIVKPRPDKSNLSIVPFDALEKGSPRAYRALVRGGATRFVRLGSTPLAICDDSGKIHRLEINIDRLAETPELNAGDLLLLRGDMIHRTQDAETERVAMSFRVSNTKAKVTRTRLASGGLQKALMMANNPAHYERMFNAFDAARRNEMTVKELKQTMESVPAPPPRGRRDFVKYLLKQKLRSHVLARFVVSVAAIYSLNMFGRASQFYARRLGSHA